jgi:hypothetical protein
MATRTDSHTVSHAESIFSGEAYTAGAEGRGIMRLGLVEADLGTPTIADVDGVIAAAVTPGPGSITLNGALTSGGVATFGVPRSFQAVSTGAGDTTQTLTVTGTDEYGANVVENLALNGVTIVFGTKAFKTITDVSVDIVLAGNLNVGDSDVLGLPYRIDNAGDLYIGNEDNVNAVPAAGVLVTADSTSPATAVTGDVRGTYNPNAVLDGVKPIKLIYKPAGRKTLTAYGVPQFAG